MHCAPSVEYPAGRSFLATLAAAMGIGAWVAMQCLWMFTLSAGDLPGSWWFSLVVGALWAVWTVWRLRRPVWGHLAWLAESHESSGEENPGRWMWISAAYRSGTPLARVEWLWDLQGVVLLRLHNAAGLSWWVWLEKSSEPDAWDDLRRALAPHRC